MWLEIPFKTDAFQVQCEQEEKTVNDLNMVNLLTYRTALLSTRINRAQKSSSALVNI